MCRLFSSLACSRHLAIVGGINRDRPYVEKPKAQAPRVGPEAARLRMRLLSTTPPPDQGMPGPCLPVELVGATQDTLILRLKNVPFDGNDEVYRYEVR